MSIMTTPAKRSGNLLRYQNITSSSDFPPNPDKSVIYRVTGSVTDASTGQSFISGDSIIWSQLSSQWEVIGQADTDTDTDNQQLSVDNANEAILLEDGGTVMQGKNYPDTNWMALSNYYSSGMGSYGSGYQIPRMRIVNNRVHLEGLVTIPNLTPKNIAVLPAGFRPLARHLFATDQQGAIPARVDVLATGEIYQFTNATQPWISLDGINFGLA